jgi:hypothetical protein
VEDETPEIERSPLSRRFSRDGITVEVKIYRLRGVNEDWSLEVVDHEDASTVWNETFLTDQEAYRAFCMTVETEGIGTFLERSETQH